LIRLSRRKELTDSGVPMIGLPSGWPGQRYSR
jgi:hypothetical protein